MHDEAFRRHQEPTNLRMETERLIRPMAYGERRNQTDWGSPFTGPEEVLLRTFRQWLEGDL
jgi:hypothetical protein